MKKDNNNSEFTSLSGDSNNKKTRKSPLKETSNEQKLLNALIKEALSKNVTVNKERMYKEECAQAVVAVLGEFLASYMLIGYDFEGTPIRIVSAKTGMDADALAQAVQRYIMMSHLSNDINS
jgi:hypothetical protein